MSAYDVYLFLHLTAAAVWIGAGFLEAVLGTRIVLSGDPGRRLDFAREAEWLGLRVFMPASLATLVFGVLLVVEGPLAFSDLWIVLGFVAIGLSTEIGMGFFGPGWSGTTRLAAAEGPDAPGVQARTARLLAFAWVDLGLLLGATWVMALKPTSDDLGALAIAAAIPVGATALGAVGRQRASQAASRGARGMHAA
jgi:hypothetical protein